MKIKLSVITILILIHFSCTKNCDVSRADSKCNEEPPTTEQCQANYTRWFFNISSNKCEEIEYTGCNIYGFDSEIDCEQCKCD